MFAEMKLAWQHYWN